MITMRCSVQGNLIKPSKIDREALSKEEKEMLKCDHFLGAYGDVFQNGEDGVRMLVDRVKRRAIMVADQCDEPWEIRMVHNGIMNQVVNYAPLSNSFTIKQCIKMDKVLLEYYSPKFGYGKAETLSFHK